MNREALDLIQKEIQRREKLNLRHELNYNNRFSEKEMKLLKILGVEEWTRSANKSDYFVYHDIAKIAFMENRQGPEIDSLRRIIKMYHERTQTKNDRSEFDELIKFEN